MARLIDGPRVVAQGGPARHLVVFLHGYGADGNDLIEIGRDWQSALPQTAFAAPHAPEPCGMAPMGRQWFALTMRDPSELTRGVVAARPALDAFLDAELQRLGLDESRLALVGFSQGTMMALHAGLRRARPPAAIVGYSGMLVPVGDLKAEAAGKPPILLVHGDSDDLIPADAMFQAADALSEAGIPCQWHLSRGLGHGIDPEGLRQGLDVLARAFGIKPPLRR